MGPNTRALDVMLEIALQATETQAYAVILALVGCVYLAAFRSWARSPFDPLLLLFVNFTFSGALVLTLAWQGSIAAGLALAYVVCSTALLGGFWAGNRDRRGGSRRVLAREAKTRDIVRRPAQKVDRGLDHDHLFGMLLCLALLNAITLLWSSLVSGLAAFSANPAVDRVGIAVSHRWLSVLSTAGLAPGIMFAGFIVLHGGSAMRRLFAGVAGLGFVLTAAGQGSKGAVLGVALTLGALDVYMRAKGISGSRGVRHWLYGIVALGVVYFAYVAGRLDPSESDRLAVFRSRVVLFGESYLYAFSGDSLARLQEEYRVDSYLAHMITAPFGLKLIPYNIGVALYGAETGNWGGFGPNPQHVIEGMAFFGAWGAPWYSFGLGYLTAWTRQVFLHKRGVFAFLGFAVCFNAATSLPVDITVWQWHVMGAVVVLLPLYYASRWLAHVAFR
jgi:hypothetical protein